MISSTEPLTWELLMEYYQELTSESTYVQPIHWPQQVIDWKKVSKFRIGLVPDSYNLFLTSASEFKRAEKVGAIWYQNEDGSRVIKQQNET